MNVNRQIIVIGDSHSRSFGGSDYFIPIFMGAGKFNNFTNENFRKITNKKLLEIMSNFKKDDYFLLTLGEADCRWNTYGSWYPSKTAKKPKNEITNSVSNSVSNFKKSILNIKSLYKNLIIYNVIPHMRDDQNTTNQIWNKNISTFCEENDLFFCDIYNEVLKDLNSHLLQLDNNRGIDPIHLSTSIQKLVIKKLQITEKPEKILINNTRFSFNERFKCFR